MGVWIFIRRWLRGLPFWTTDGTLAVSQATAAALSYLTSGQSHRLIQRGVIRFNERARWSKSDTCSEIPTSWIGSAEARISASLWVFGGFPAGSGYRDSRILNKPAKR